MFEIIALVALLILAWRIPAVFDYLVLTPFLGTGLGMFAWSIAGMFSVDIWHWNIVGLFIISGILTTALIVTACNKRG
jgi:hypothetical protein